MVNFREACQLLQNTARVSDRQGAAAELTAHFNNPRAFSSHNTQDWVELFDALKVSINIEKSAYVSATAGKTSAAEKRLVNIAQLLRKVIVGAVEFLPFSGLAETLLDHLTSFPIVKNKLLEPVALEYIKSLRCLLEWNPNLDRMNEHLWLSIVQFAFNAVLGDPLRREFCEDDTPTASPSASADIDDDSDEPAASPRKRRKLKYPSQPVAKRRTQLVPSPEQNELLPCLRLLLRHPSAPLLLKDHDYLPAAILSRLQRFLDQYSQDASFYQDYLLLVLHTLSHLSMNRNQLVMQFACRSWESLVGLWGTKNKGLKECLVAVLYVIFPYLKRSRDSKAPEKISLLCKSLESEAENRWGAGGLSLDSLRLEVDHEDHGGRRAFVARTFLAGSNFSDTQALAWAILELQADCMYQLYQHSENIFSSSQQRGPITSLLTSLDSATQSHVRVYRLQTLLFIISRHWSALHDDLQTTVFVALKKCITSTDQLVQSWALMCIAAITHADTRTGNVPPIRDWDMIWAHALRRTNVPNVARAACHAAYVMLLCFQSRLPSQRIALTSQNVLLEIEALAKDLDVQGPPFPYDSVCAFISQALKMASQDVRLHRKQFEDKTLSWLSDCWTPQRTGGTNLYAVRDIMLLLESICGISRRSDLFSRIVLPECLIATTLIEEERTRIIREYLLDANLPGLPQTHHPSSNELTSDDKRNGDEPAEESPRERRISAFLTKSLEALASELGIMAQSSVLPTADKSRAALDWAVIGLSFQSLLALNGTRSNRRALQAACKLMLVVIPLLRDSRWKEPEQASVLLALEPLTSTGAIEDDGAFSAAFSPPDLGSGIKAGALAPRPRQKGDSEVRRVELQMFICKSTDVQDCFMSVVEVLRDILRRITGQHGSSQTRDADFDNIPIRATQSGGSTGTANVRHIAEMCISFLSVIPLRLSASGEPTRDPDLTDLVFECTTFDRLRGRSSTLNERSLLVYEVFLFHVKHNHLAFSHIDYDRFSFELSKTLHINKYYNRSDIAHMLTICFLDSNLSRWVQFSGDSAYNTRMLCGWLSVSLKGKSRTHLRSWKARDALARFYDRYLDLDPRAVTWFDAVEDDPKYAGGQPTLLLPTMNVDDDIRVRFRAGVLVINLLTVRRTQGLNSTDVYKPILDSYPRDLERMENMLTRILSLANAMIVSSAVRRGAYWHLLEAGFYGDTYDQHTRTVLAGVAERLCLPKFASLFEAYASQLAYTMKSMGMNFLHLRPDVLGYRDRRECAQANFRAFTPTNLVADGPAQAQDRGLGLFASLCTNLHKSPEDGIRECFADIVGYELLQNIISAQPLPHQDFKATLLRKLAMTDEAAQFDAELRRNVDGIVFWIVRALGEQNFRPDGPISDALMDQNRGALKTFQALVRHRRVDDFEAHEPNNPAFPARDVLQALSWFDDLVPDADTAATAYHVTHELFAEIHRSVMVNEQLRLLNALCLWIAVRNDCFQNLALLQVLVRGATSLMAQSELARAAQSILEWVFGCFISLNTDDPRLANVLIRVSCFANDYAEQVLAPLKTLGEELRVWIDGQICHLAKSQPLESSIVRALSAWRHTPSPELAELVSNFTSTSLSNVLSDSAIVSNKFRLVRQLRDHAASGEGDQAQFAETDFWRLRECIPPSDQLQIEDVDAFAGLLELHEGRITSFVTEQASARGRHRRDTSAAAHPQEWLVYSLLGMLEASDSAQAHVAYNTLRLIVSVTPANTWKQLPSQYSDEIGYLRSYQRIPHTRPSRTLDELGHDVAFLETTGNFPRWVSSIAILLSDILSVFDPFYAQLFPILESDPSFTESALPVLVRSILESERSKNLDQPLSELPVRTTLSTFFANVLRSDKASTACIQSIVDIVLHLRNFGPPQAPIAKNKIDCLAYDKWLAMDYTLLAGKALVCGAYTTSLLFLELAVDNPWKPPDDKASAKDTDPEDILYEIYAHIDEPDGFYGINARDTNKFIMKRLHHEKQWNKAFQFHSAALEASSTNVQEASGLLRAFHSFGFHHLAMDTLQKSSLSGGAPIKSDMSYQLGWRTETWDLPEQTEEGGPGVSLYNALRAVYRARSPRAIQAVVHRSIFSEMERLRVLGSENLTEIRDAAQNLMCLNQVSQWFKAESQSRLGSRRPNVADWASFVELGKGFEFSDFETVMATRMALVRSVRRKEERQQIGNMTSPLCKSLIEVEKQCLIGLSQAARDAQQNQIALNSVIRAQSLEPMSPSLEVSVEFANVLRLQKEEKLAVQFLKSLNLKSLSGAEQAIILARLGTWMAEARLEKPTDISAWYFEPATQLIKELDKQTSGPLAVSHAAVYRQYATFAEQQYKTINNSKDAIRWKVYVERKTREIHHRKTQGEKTDSKPWKDAVALLKFDQESYEKHISAREAFLTQAIDMHSRALAASSEDDGDGAIRLSSLWFENFNELGFEFQRNVGLALERTPSWKLVFLAHQLTARLAKSSDANQMNLQNVVMRMCVEHPFHSLYQVFGLLPSEEQQPGGLRRQSGRQNSPVSQSSSRAAAALEIFRRLRADPKSGQRVKDVQLVATACLQWAKFEIKDTELDPGHKTFVGHKVVRYIPSAMVIRKIRNLEVPVLTHSTPLDPTLKYDQCVFIDRYEQTFETAGGINLPKITKCVGSDGARYKQLFKGEGHDDLRQDAVMEQVFSLCNTVLRSDRETNRRSLNVRGYKIVPLGSQAGVLEFVANTTPLGSWLGRAHAKYNIGDMEAAEFGSKFKRLWEEYKGSKPQMSIDLYLEVRKRFRPALRHFFTEKHKTPMAWFTMRLAYTRSVATTSLVGHVLGLGDRHTSNILLDTETGEVVHIDLGIAFEQGKLLKVPELVPFRMTRDIVDGMGSTGTGGVFQRCAEETLRVLREGSAVIMTVLEVFKHDPLHSWTASEIKLKHVQEGASRLVTGDIGIDMTSGTVDEAADRALTGVARKLDKSMSVEYTVNELIAEATDTNRLGIMWHGEAAFLWIFFSITDLCRVGRSVLVA
ncbi:hypothetical protein C8F01DRAFT_981361 [Mycena amicta]|nr:hypothetical protein C8F01DRAFT_981361 [Mycena amicta]